MSRRSILLVIAVIAIAVFVAYLYRGQFLQGAVESEPADLDLPPFEHLSAAGFIATVVPETVQLSGNGDTVTFTSEMSGSDSRVGRLGGYTVIVFGADEILPWSADAVRSIDWSEPVILALYEPDGPEGTTYVYRIIAIEIAP
jgi:hypothetical protein